MHQGSCLCGQIQFECEQIIGDTVLCHCRSCRKSSGSAFGANAAVPIQAFRITNGDNLLKQFESSPGKVRNFCGHCGSPLFTRVSDSAFVRIRLGALDTAFSDPPKAHIFLDHKAQWDQPCEGLQEYRGWPDFEHLNIAGTTAKPGAGGNA